MPATAARGSLDGAAGETGGRGRPGEHSAALSYRLTPGPSDPWTARDRAYLTLEPQVSPSRLKAKLGRQTFTGVDPKLFPKTEASRDPAHSPTHTKPWNGLRPTCAVSKCPPTRLRRAPPAPVLTALGEVSALRRAWQVRSAAPGARSLPARPGQRARHGLRSTPDCSLRLAPGERPTPAPPTRQARGALCRRRRLPKAPLHPRRYKPHRHWLPDSPGTRARTRTSPTMTARTWERGCAVFLTWDSFC